MGEFRLLIYYIQQIPIKIWHIVSGVFFLGWRMKFEKRRQDREDTHHFFKVENRKRMTRLTLKAQKDLKTYQEKKKVYPKKAMQKGMSAFHNYFATVVAPINYKMTLDKALASYYYDAIGPYFEALYYLRGECLQALNNPHPLTPEKKKFLRDRLAAFPPLEKISKKNMDEQKAIIEKIRQEEYAHNAKKEQAQLEQDREFFELEIKMQKERADEAEKRIKEMQRMKKEMC